MKKIVKLEFIRAKKIYNKKLLITLFLSLIIILLFFFFILKTGGIFHNLFYTYYSENEDFKYLLDYNDKFIHTDAKASLFIMKGQRINLVPSGFSGTAAAQSVYDFVKEYNYYIYEDLHDPSLLLIRLISVNQTESQLNETKVNEEDLRNQQIPELNNVEEIVEKNVSSTVEEKLPENNSVEKNNEKITIIDEMPKEIEEQRIKVYEKFKQERETINQQISEDINKEIEYDDKELLTAKDLEPRLPFNQIYLSMSFIIVLTFISLMYTNRIMDEKINNKGVLLLVAPIKTRDIVMGKTILYYAIALFLSIIIGLIHIRSIASFLVFLLVINGIILMYLSISFFIGVFARSFKEMSFMGIFGISLYSLFLLIPVFLMNFSDASYASPLTVIVKTLINEPVNLKLLLFSAVPHILFAFAIYYIGTIMYNAEDLFNYRKLNKKIYDFFVIYLQNLGSFFLAGVFSLFPVFIIEVMLIMILLTIKTKFAIFIIIFLSAAVEEIIRNYPLFVYLNKKFNFSKEKVSLVEIMKISIVLGGGFFLAEKLLLIISIAAFYDGFSLIQFGSLIIPLIVHVVLTFLFGISYKVSKSKVWPFVFTIILHFVTNITIMYFFNNLK